VGDDPGACAGDAMGEPDAAAEPGAPVVGAVVGVAASGATVTPVGDGPGWFEIAA
jgi:hypothetical protein